MVFGSRMEFWNHRIRRSISSTVFCNHVGGVPLHAQLSAGVCPSLAAALLLHLEQLSTELPLTGCHTLLRLEQLLTGLPLNLYGWLSLSRGMWSISTGFFDSLFAMASCCCPCCALSSLALGDVALQSRQSNPVLPPYQLHEM